MKPCTCVVREGSVDHNSHYFHPQTRLVMCYQAPRDKSLPSQPQHLIVPLPYATGKYLVGLMRPAISKGSFKSTKARHYLTCLSITV